MTQEELDAIRERDKTASCAGPAQKDRRALLAYVDRLRAAMAPFARFADAFDGKHSYDETFYGIDNATSKGRVEITLSDFRAARDALGQKGAQP